MKKPQKTVKKKIKKLLKTKTIKNLVKSHANDTGIMPLGSRVLIKPFTREELAPKNSFGIILPDTGGKEKSEQGMVLAVGPGDYHDGKLIAPRLKVGDRVAFSKYGYEDVNVNGEELFLIKEENILAILKK